jgi:hypothetical protein
VFFDGWEKAPRYYLIYQKGEDLCEDVKEICGEGFWCHFMHYHGRMIASLDTSTSGYVDLFDRSAWWAGHPGPKGDVS